MHLIAALTWFLVPAHWLTILTVAAGLGFVIFVHELGHFLVAKACGVKCEKFYLGFDIAGIKIVHFQWGETEYGIGILPLGGYVKMLGQDDNPAQMAQETQRAKLQAANSSSQAGEHAPPLTHGDLPPEPVSDPHEPYDPRSYMAQSVPKRMAIISAGVIMNVIFAFILASIAYGIGVKETPCVVGGVLAGGPAWQADFQPGDIVRRIGAIENPRFRDLQTGVTLGVAEHGVEFEIYRPSTDKTFVVTVQPDTSLGVPMIGILGPAEPLLNDEEPVVEPSPASSANPKFEGGDRIVGMSGSRIASQLDVETALMQSWGRSTDVAVRRSKSSDNKTDKVRPEEIQTNVDAAPLRDFGMVMSAEPISAVQQNSPAAKASLIPGDRLVSLNGQPVGNPLTLPARMQKAAEDEKTVRLEIDRSGGSSSGKSDPAKTVVVELMPRRARFYDTPTPFGPMSVDQLGIAFKVLTKVNSIELNTPASGSKIEPGDEVLAARIIPLEKTLDHKRQEPDTLDFVKNPAAWPSMIEGFAFLDPQQEVELTIAHGSEKRTVKLSTTELKDEQGNTVYAIQRGFRFDPLYEIRTARSFADALRMGREETIDSLLLVYRFLQRITQGRIPATSLGGPVEIAKQAGRSAEKGFGDFLVFLTMLSANLAVINFLPIPVLDGGHMVFLAYELFRRKPASERVVVAFTYAGLMFILSLMLFVLALDTGLISRH